MVSTGKSQPEIWGLFYILLFPLQTPKDVQQIESKTSQKEEMGRFDHIS